MKEITKPNPQIGVFDVCALSEEDKRVEVVSFFEQEGYVLLLCEELKDHPIIREMRNKACFDELKALCVIRNGGKNFNARFHRNIDIVDNRVMSKKNIKTLFSEQSFEEPYQIRGMAKVLLRGGYQKSPEYFGAFFCLKEKRNSLHYILRIYFFIEMMTETALVLIDFQQEWRDPESEYYVGDLTETLSKVNYLIDYCRARDYKIIWTKHRETDSIDAFGPETQIIPDLKQEENDIVMIKNKISPFYNTSLDQELQGIKKVIVCGILTNLCVRSFIQDAYDRDFHITVIKDCCVAHTPEIQEFTFFDLAQTREEIEFIDFKIFVE